MMKIVCLSLALLLAAVSAQNSNPICLPNRWQWKRSQEFQGWGQDGGFDFMIEFFDYNAQKFRNIFDIQQQNTEYFQDIVVYAAEKKVWIINGTRGGGAVKCEVHTADFPIRPACLLQNATQQGVFFMAGDTAVFNWFEEFDIQTADGPYRVHQFAGMTVADNIPVISRELYSKVNSQDVAGSSLEIFFDYSINLDSDAFKLPAICPTSLDSNSRKISAAEMERRAPGWLVDKYPVSQRKY